MMEDGFWELFRNTGAPVFYLLYRWEKEEGARAMSAWSANGAAEI